MAVEYDDNTEIFFAAEKNSNSINKDPRESQS
jgi:hypothetical protein